MSEKKNKKTKKPYDPEKRARIKYYFKLSGGLALILLCVAAGMFFYLRHEALDYRQQRVSELVEGMEDAKELCADTLRSYDAESDILESIDTQYETAMKESDIFQQSYLVDGIIDYSLSNLYTIITFKHQEDAREGNAWTNYEEDIDKVIDVKTSLGAIKEQISSIDPDNVIK